MCECVKIGSINEKQKQKMPNPIPPTVAYHTHPDSLPTPCPDRSNDYVQEVL